MNERDDKPRAKRAYAPPAIEDIPINPDERLLVPCKSAGSINPVCGLVCGSCSSEGS